MAIAITSPKKSSVLEQYGQAFLTDQNGNKVPVVAVVYPDASNNLPLTGLTVKASETSHVTGLDSAPRVQTPGGKQIPVLAIVGLDASGNIIPGPVAPKGVFTSTVVTATGSSQNVAHGLGVVPSKVLVSAYDNTSAATFAIAEGAHDATNVKVTATSGLKFKVLAFA